LNLKIQTYLFITYIVTSKPKRISVAAGFVHMLNLLKLIIKYNTIYVLNNIAIIKKSAM